MTNKSFITRRSFIKRGSGSALAVTAPMLVSEKVWGANDTVGLGVIGPGRRGQQLMGDFSRTQGSQFVAISDVNKKRMDKVAAGKDWKTYQDYRDLLEDKDVDAVIVATPDHWHALNSIHACMAGKDVYVEKPMTLTIAEGRAMVKAARKNERIVQCGSQQRSMTNCRIGCELVRNEVFGKVKVVHGANYESPWDQPFSSYPVPEGLDWDMWLGPAEKRGYHPDIYTPRAKPGWISIMPYSGGEVTGWGAHGIDIMQWALGTVKSGPVEIWTEGSYRDLYRPVHMRYEDGVEVRMDNKGPAGGGFFECEDGTILIDRGRYKTDPEIDLDELDLKEKLEVSRNHQQNFIDCVKSRERPIADVEEAHRSTTMCHFMNLVRWTARKLTWDPKKEVFIDDDDANTYLDRPRRDPWELPKL